MRHYAFPVDAEYSCRQFPDSEEATEWTNKMAKEGWRLSFWAFQVIPVRPPPGLAIDSVGVGTVHNVVMERIIPKDENGEGPAQPR